jgi:hypothetical protein
MIMVRVYPLINHVLDSIYILDSCHIFCLIDFEGGKTQEGGVELCFEN